MFDRIANALIEHFEDKDQGGFYFTSHDHEQLILRSKTYSDDAIPSGNGMAAIALLQLGYLTGSPGYLDAAERCLQAAWHSINQASISHCTLLQALDYYLNPPKIVIIRGTIDKLQSWREKLRNCYTPSILCFFINNKTKLGDSLAETQVVGDVCAYVCEGMTCSSPITSENEFVKLVDENRYML